jgi:hypothetical protein
VNFPRISERPDLPGGEPCHYAATYGMGMIASQDCDLGATLAHGGGYPGYGSYLLLLPEHDVGIFAFANRTYAAPVLPVIYSALELYRANLLSGRPTPVSSPLAASYAAAGAMFEAGTVEPARQMLAMNFLLDRSSENWARQLGEFKTEVGDCRTDAPITATGGLSGRFRWTCERGALDGQLLLAPTSPPTIQALRLSVAQPPATP